MQTGERQSARMRMQYLKSVLSQDVSFFDTKTSTGEIISSISTDIVVVQDAISDKVYILNLQIRMSLYSFKIMAVHFILFCILTL
jgi:ATP-binding cassette subfamily B (MDR/TAP) protein 1